MNILEKGAIEAAGGYSQALDFVKSTRKTENGQCWWEGHLNLEGGGRELKDTTAH